MFIEVISYTALKCLGIRAYSLPRNFDGHLHFLVSQNLMLIFGLGHTYVPYLQDFVCLICYYVVHLCLPTVLSFLAVILVHLHLPTAQ